jgi:chromosome segregation ATPase
VQTAVIRARESELDDVRACYTTSEDRANNLVQRLKLSGTELRKTEEALRSSQRQARCFKQQLEDSSAQVASLKSALSALDSKQDDVQVGPQLPFVGCFGAMLLRSMKDKCRPCARVPLHAGMNRSLNRLQVHSRQTEQDLWQMQAEATRLRAALKASENLVADRESRIVDLHENLHSLDARKGDLQMAVADASGQAGKMMSQTQAMEARLRAMQRQVNDSEEESAIVREQLAQVRVRRLPHRIHHYQQLLSSSAYVLQIGCELG